MGMKEMAIEVHASHENPGKLDGSDRARASDGGSDIFPFPTMSPNTGETIRSRGMYGTRRKGSSKVAWLFAEIAFDFYTGPAQ